LAVGNVVSELQDNEEALLSHGLWIQWGINYGVSGCVCWAANVLFLWK
jgi:hypothetical protein